MKPANRKPVVFGVVGAFLLVIFLQMILMARDNSATYDEPFHIYAGYLQWKHGYVLLNPPLITRMITLPLIGMNLPEPPIPRRPYEPLGFQAGKALVFQNDATTIMFRARMAASVFTLLLAILVFAAARRMFGLGAGFVALGLIAFDPTLMGHSALAALDAGNAFFMLWAVYAFYRYVKSPAAWRLIGTSLIVGLALTAKHSAILLFPTLVIFAAIELLWPKKLSPEAPAVPTARHALRLGLALAAIGVVSITMLWAAYGFRYPQADAVPFNPPMDVQLQRIPSALNAKVLGEVDKLHLLPAPYTYAFANILSQAKSYTSYILGVVHPHAVWFYFPVSMLIKSSLTFLILLAISAWAVAAGKLRLSREVLYTAIPAVLYMAFSMTGGMNIGVRHILPVYIFLAIPIAGAAWALAERNRRWLYAVVGLLVFQAVSVLHAFPAYISGDPPTPTSTSATRAPIGASNLSPSSAISMRAASRTAGSPISTSPPSTLPLTVFLARRCTRPRFGPRRRRPPSTGPCSSVPAFFPALRPAWVPSIRTTSFRASSRARSSTTASSCMTGISTSL